MTNQHLKNYRGPEKNHSGDSTLLQHMHRQCQKKYNVCLYFHVCAVQHEINGSKIQLDSQDFYKHVMQQHGSRRFGMKAIVETLATDNVKKFYSENKHSALGDAETLCKLSYSRLLHDRFRNWVICFQSLIGPTNVNLERKRSQSVQRFIPG